MLEGGALQYNSLCKFYENGVTFGKLAIITMYRIEENFGEIGKDRQIKNSPISIIVCMPMELRIQIAEFNLLSANSPNLMLAKNFPLNGSLLHTHVHIIVIL